MITEYLKRERSGASTFEWILTLPFTIFIVFFIFYIMLMLFSWASYGGVASNVAKDLNVRSTGLVKANHELAESGNVIMQGKTAYNYSYTITKDQVTVNGKTSGNALLNSYKNAVIYHMTEYKNQFYFPYTKFKSINVDFLQLNSDGTYSETFDASSTLSNVIVKVDINYEFAPFSFMKVALPGVSLFSTGYGIIT